MEILRWKKIAGKAAFHAARSTKTAANPLRMHGHDFAEIFWIDAGEGTHRINGTLIALKPGCLVLMRPDDRHGIETKGGVELKLTNIAFPCETLEALVPRYYDALMSPFSVANGRCPMMRRIDGPRRHRYNRWADELAHSPRDERLYLDRFLLNVLADLEREPGETTLPDLPPWLREACRAIQSPDHFVGGVEEFLRLCGRSREHVARSVRHFLDTTPTDYVNDIRIAYAIRELEMGDQAIMDIALECGMPNLSHFYALFQARMSGMTPRAYRLMHCGTV